jgi:hypothetical protein
MALFGLQAMSDLRRLFRGKAEDIGSHRVFSPFDPQRTSANISCCSSEVDFQRLSKYWLGPLHVRGASAFDQPRCGGTSLAATPRQRPSQNPVDDMIE